MQNNFIANVEDTFFSLSLDKRLEYKFHELINNLNRLYSFICTRSYGRIVAMFLDEQHSNDILVW